MIDDVFRLSEGCELYCIQWRVSPCEQFYSNWYCVKLKNGKIKPKHHL